MPLLGDEGEAGVEIADKDIEVCKSYTPEPWTLGHHSDLQSPASIPRGCKSHAVDPKM
jgi:hypothetical protein